MLRMGKRAGFVPATCSLLLLFYTTSAYLHVSLRMCSLQLIGETETACKWLFDIIAYSRSHECKQQVMIPHWFPTVVPSYIQVDIEPWAFFPVFYS